MTKDISGKTLRNALKRRGFRKPSGIHVPGRWRQPEKKTEISIRDLGDTNRERLATAISQATDNGCKVDYKAPARKG